jgi:hypothetical protein
MRNEGGWNVGRKEGLLDPGRSFLSPLYGGESNTLFTEMLSWGFDIRNQIAKRPDVHTGTLKRKSFFMQVAPYVSFRPVDKFEIMATYNFIDPEFPGQQRFMASASYTFADAVSVEAGFIQPDFGIRHDDHTTFTRSMTRLWPYYQDLGAQLTIHPVEWLSITGGLFDASNRREAVGFLKEHSMMGLAGATFMLADFDAGYSIGGGVSVLFQDGQKLAGMHVGAGLIDRATILAEYVRADHALTSDSPPLDIVGFHASYQLVDGLALTARFEQAMAENSSGETQTTKQIVLGAQIFIVPYIELRPEYRWYDDPLRRTAQYTGQFHLFF